jgi:hypothetical protein
MSAIPIHLQRRFEQKWASRFALPVAVALKNVGTKATTGRRAVAPKTEEKPTMVKVQRSPV